MAQVTKAEQLNIDKVKRLIGQTPLGLAATAINSIILVLVLWGLTPVSRLLLWLSAALSVSVIRLFLQLYLKKKVLTTDNTKSILNLFLSTLFVSGCIWGSAGIFLLPSSSIAHQVFIAFVLGGMVAGSVGVFSPVPASYYCFSIPALFPITVCFFRMGTEIHSAMGAMVTLFWFIMLLTAKKLNREMTESLNLKYENVDLISDLEKEIKERKGAEERLIKRNQEIEIIVQKRTEELRGVNEALLNEIEERKVAEKALQESEKRYRSILQTATDGFCLLDSDGRLLDVNDAYCKMSGYSRQEILSMSVSDLEASESPEDVLIHIESVIGQGGDRFETRLRRKDGGIIDAEVSVGFHPEERGRLFAFFRDITERKRAEEEQGRLQAQLSNALEIANLAPWEYDVINDLFRFNDHFYKIFHTTVEQVGGYTMSSAEYAQRFLHPDDKHIVEEEVRRLLEETDPDYSYQQEHRILYADGTVGYITVRAFSVKDANGQAVKTYGVNQDITERKGAEIEQEKLQAQLSNALEMANLAPWEYDVASDLFLLNDHFYKIYRTTAEEMEGYTISSEEFARRFVPPDDINQFLKNLQESSRSPAKDLKQRIERRALFGDGTVGFVSINLLLVKDSQGKTIRTYGATQDITEQKQAEMEKEKLQAQLSNALEIANLAPWEYDVANDFFTFNDHFYKLFRTTVEEVGGYTMSSAEYAQRFLHPDDRRLVGEEIRKMLETTDPNYSRQLEHRILYADGTVGSITVRIFIVKDAHGQTVKSYGVNQDITERKRIEEELLKSEKLESTGVLAGGIAHDFNNILTTILGNISLAKTNVTPEDEIFDLLNEAETASNRARALTRQLLTFSKGGTPLKETTTIKKMLKESSLFVLRGSKSSCVFSMDEDLWPVEVDIGQISQVIHNVVINANQAMPQGGTIRVEAKNLMLKKRYHLPLKSGRYIRISITDQGIGIGEKDLSRIFDPYYTTKQQGSGLGLATSYSIINRHGGHIAVESRLEVGTTFHIYLPASNKTVPQKEESHLIKGRGRILVMDDDAPLKKTLGRMLEKLGYEPGFAKDGIEAIRLFKEAKESEKPFDAVILDLTVPGGMGGKEALPKILDIDPEVKAIVSSGYSDDPVLSNYREYGFMGMISKPFEPSSLSKVLHEVLKEKSL